MNRAWVATLFLLLTPPGCRMWHHTDVRRVMVVVGPSWVGIPEDQRSGLRLITEDLAETSGATVLGATMQTPPGVLQIILGGTLTPQGLRLQARLMEEGTPPRDLVSGDGDPRQQLKEILAATGLRSSASDAILPRNPADLLPLAAVYATSTEGSDQASRAAEAPAETLVALEPHCAPAALARAESIYRRLLTKPSEFDSQMVCAEAFDRALALLPGYPRAAQNAGRFYTDTADQRQAFDLLFKAESLWPKTIGPKSCLSYAARTAGLLDGALVALKQKENLDGRMGSPDSLPETTFLYAGDWTRFDESLGPGPGEQPAALRDFYRGYLRLLQGRRTEALANFRAASPSNEGDQFPILAKVYQLGLEGHQAEALLTLRNLSLSRQALRAPDGEFTFKIAEAFAFLGDTPAAMDHAQSAFSQGFGCTPWYEKSPLLAPLHDLPRWRALVSHLHQRMALLESHYPAALFQKTD